MFLILPPHKPMVNSAIRIPGMFGDKVKVILNVTNVNVDYSLIFRIHNEGHYHRYIQQYYARYYGGNSFEVLVPEAVLNNQEFIVASQMKYSQLMALHEIEPKSQEVGDDRMIMTLSDPFQIS